MRVRCCAAFLAALLPSAASAQVFINEIVKNPPTPVLDDDFEYVELLGPPNMKLDGYAVAHISGTEEKLHPIGSIPPPPTPDPEIDELFSLDGLTLGANGILVIGPGIAAGYDQILPDSNFARWDTMFNGGLDTPGKFENDGSGTLVLIRNRPGVTEADPTNPAGLRWGKDIKHDIDYIVPVIDPDDNSLKAQYGDGKYDDGGVTLLGFSKLDLVGTSTPDPLDDLEIVDEVSFESGRGLEYDADIRNVDTGSTVPGLPGRKVHALDDPQGFNPDALSRVDYRTKGPGWAPATGATGELPSGNNWQDTATEQWIRGELDVATGGIGLYQVFYSNLANTNVDSIQPFLTNVPLWLDDGVAPDFDFTSYSYQMLPGRLNPLAVPFIPGDADRDGDADQDDIDAIASRFGDTNLIFANGSAAAANGGAIDPATQVRPWNIDSTGDNGIEPSDLQWTLNFQGDTTGQIVGRTYDSVVPASAGVTLNDGGNVAVSLTAAATSTCGRPISGLFVNDLVEVVVSGEITGGANLVTGHENGIQQFVHDLTLGTSGVLEVESIEALGAFSTTRASLQQTSLSGVTNLNGYATSFSQGLSGAAEMYVVRLRAVAVGQTAVFINSAAKPEFSISTPRGVKVGHTNFNGNPGITSYPNAFLVDVIGSGIPGSAAFAFGNGCAGTGGFVPALAGSGCPAPGGSLTLSITDGLPGAFPLMFLGLGDTSASLTPVCQLQINPLFPIPPIGLIPLFGSGAGNGFLTLPGLGIPATTPSGLTVFLQVLYADAGGVGGVAGTNPLRVFIGL